MKTGDALNRYPYPYPWTRQSVAILLEGLVTPSKEYDGYVINLDVDLGPELDEIAVRLNALDLRRALAQGIGGNGEDGVAGSGGGPGGSGW